MYLFEDVDEFLKIMDAVAEYYGDDNEDNS